MKRLPWLLVGLLLAAGFLHAATKYNPFTGKPDMTGGGVSLSTTTIAGTTWTWTGGNTWTSSATFQNANLSVNGTTFVVKGSSVGIGTAVPATPLEIKAPFGLVGLKLTPSDRGKGFGIYPWDNEFVPSWADATSPYVRINVNGAIVFNPGSAAGSNLAFNYDYRASKPVYFDGTDIYFNNYNTGGVAYFKSNTDFVAGKTVTINGTAAIPSGAFSVGGSTLTTVSGKVGISTGAPQATLDVNGTAQATGFYTTGYSTAGYFVGNGSLLTNLPTSGGGGYAVEPATVTFQLNKGFTASTGTFSSTATFNAAVIINSASQAPVIESTFTAFYIDLTDTSDHDFAVYETSAYVNGSQIATLPVSSGASALAVATGTAASFTGLISSPTAVINFNSSQFSGQLTGGATAYLTLNTSSVTLQGPIVSSITLSAMYGAPTLSGANFTSVASSALDSSSITKQGPFVSSVAVNSIGVAQLQSMTLPTTVVASSVTQSAYYSHATVRSNLGLAIGTNVQAYDATLDDLAAAPLSEDNSVGVGAIADGQLPDGVKVTTGNVSATSGSPSATTYLRGDNTWATPGGSGDAVLAGTQTFSGQNTFSGYVVHTGSITFSSTTVFSGNSAPVITTTYPVLTIGINSNNYLIGTSSIVTPSNQVLLSTGITAQSGTVNTATNPVDWTMLKNVPAGFADGTDDGGVGGSDNLGNHVATKTLDMANFGIVNSTFVGLVGGTPVFSSTQSAMLWDVNGTTFTLSSSSKSVQLNGYTIAVATKCFTVTISSSTGWDNLAIPVSEVSPDKAITIQSVRAAVLGGTSLVFNLEERAWASLASAGTDIAADMTADADGLITTSFTNAGIAAGAHLVFTTAGTAATGAVDYVTITVFYTVDK